MEIIFFESSEIPGDFPTQAHESAYKHVVQHNGRYPDHWRRFSGGWRAAIYRFRACAEHDEVFTHLVRTFGDAPAQPMRYEQEREVFEFFVNGLAAIESICFGLHAVGAMISPQNFPMQSDNDERSVTISKTRQRFASAYPTEPISAVLQSLEDDQQYKAWRDARNVLAHRTLPGRTIYGTTGGQQEPPADWFGGIVIDVTTTSSRRAWLSSTLAELLNASAQFIRRHL